MIGLVLAAGRGSRLGSYTENLPKSLLPLNVNEYTILNYNLDVLTKLKLDKILIVTGFESDRIEKVALDYPNIEIVYNPFWNYCNVLGSMYMALDKIDDDFLFLHADTLMEFEAWQLLAKVDDGDMVLPYEAKKCGEEEMKVIIENEEVIRVSKQFDGDLASGEFVGIALFRKHTVPYFRRAAQKLFKQGDLQHYMESVVQMSIDEKVHSIKPLDVTHFNFVEVDFEEDYERAKKLFG